MNDFSCVIPILLIVCGIISIVAFLNARACREELGKITKRLDLLSVTIDRLPQWIESRPEKTPSPPVQEPAKPEPAKRTIEDLLSTQPSKPAPEKTSATIPPVAAFIKTAPAQPMEMEQEHFPAETEPFTAKINLEWWTKFEENIGKRWMTWVGVLALFLGVGFFVKYAIDNQWLGPAARVSICVAFGIVLLVAGAVFVKRQMRALGQGLLGGGLAILYVSFFAAFAYYKLIPQPAAFLAMVVVTALGMILAIACDAVPISFLATLGGFLTPILVSTGQNAREVLFTYLVLLDLGVLGIAFFKRWRALDVLAFAGTIALFAGWFLKFYEPSALYPTLAWLLGFYLLFLFLPFINHLRFTTPATIERFTMALSNATLVFICSYVMLYPENKSILGFVTLAMAVCYVLLGSIFRIRIPADKTSVFGFIALAMMFLTIAIPLHLGLNGITLAWAGESAVLVYLGYRFAYFPVRVGGFIVLIINVIRLFLRHWPLHENQEIFTPILNSRFSIGFSICAALAIYAVIHHQWRNKASSWDRILKIISALAAGFLTLILLHAEFGQWFTFKAGEWSMKLDDVYWSVLAILWALGGLAYIVGGIIAKCKPSRYLARIPLTIAAVLSIQAYRLYSSEPHLFFNLRFLAAAITIFLFFVSAGFLRRFRGRQDEEDQQFGIHLFTISGFLLPILLSTEIHLFTLTFNQYYYRGACSLVPLWAVTGLIFLAAGIRAQCRQYRLAGLIPLLAALLLAVRVYDMQPGFHYPLLLNLRFAAVLVAILALFAYAFILNRYRKILTGREINMNIILYTAAGFAMLLLFTTEISHFASMVDDHYFGPCSLVVLWTVGALIFLLAGVKSSSTVYRFVGLVPLLIMVILGLRLYFRDLNFSYSLLLNTRFMAELFGALAILVYAAILNRSRENAPPSEKDLAKFLYIAGAILLLGLLSIEPCRYWLTTIRDPQKARWLVQMSLSIVWSLYALTALGIGFWRQIRNLRLAALALFGLTALKLVLVDMASLQQIYRIVSFIVLGLLMIGASYLYHRLEKRLELLGKTKE